jgi:acyl-CoA synthetase (AMP-forming)/AMP-acid ligase II/pimeloyl-ACP methyl ester carboxylesterase
MTTTLPPAATATAPAALPPAGLPGLDPAWSRLVTVRESPLLGGQGWGSEAHAEADDDALGAPSGRRVPPTPVDGGDRLDPPARAPRPERTWHVLDTGARLAELGVAPVGTLLCVHGNPTWSYLWRALLDASVRQAADGGPAWRVVAVDQLEMGFSERTGTTRGLRRRVRDLGDLTDALALEGPVVTVGHDWGGVVSLGWAVDHRDLVSGVVLHNTAVHQPEGEPVPAPLRLALGVLGPGTVRTPAFLETTLALARPPLAPAVREAYRAPYPTAERRGGIGAFVADIPATSDHPSFPELDRIAEGVRRLDVPALLLWGPRDPVFGDRYLDDLVDRLPRADVHRFEGASHLLAEDVDHAGATLTWLGDRHDAVVRPQPMAFGEQPIGQADDEPVGRPPHEAGAQPAAGEDVAARDDVDALAGVTAVTARGWSGPEQRPPLWQRLDELADSPATALVEMAPPQAVGSRLRGALDAALHPGAAPSADPQPRTVSWRLLSRRVREIAAGLHALGVQHGDRVSLLVPPGADLTAVLYACLRIGAVVVVADAGLGVQGLTRAVRGAQPDHVIGAAKGLTAARALGWPGTRISTTPLSSAAATALGVELCLADVVDLGRVSELPPEPAPDDVAAILFTSGSTGPAKGVVYRHEQLAAVRDVLAARYGLGVGDGLVAGFAPFALLGPALGCLSVTPDMDVTAPRTLTARAVAAAVRAADGGARAEGGTVGGGDRAGVTLFLSPAAIGNVVATAEELEPEDRDALAGVRTFLSAGAPVPVRLLERAGGLMPHATAHTPYGMTEGLLLTDITLDGIRAAGDGGAAGGVCVGRPAPGVEVRISPLDDDGAATGPLTTGAGVTGEVVVAAPHVRDHYDRLWLTERASRRLHRDDDAAPRGLRWHRTGDVGRLDDDGRLWVEGRLAHVVVTADGVVTPVGPEQRAESVPGVARAAVVGVGPRGTQQLVVVAETEPRVRRPAQVTPELAAAVRAAVGRPVAAVLAVAELPTDVRHNSKIDRARLAAWAEGVLAGGPVGAP